MTDACCDIPDAPADANPIEKADVAVARAMAPIRKSPVVRALGTLSEIGDQPEMRLLCAGVIAAGLWCGDAKLAGAGARMLVAHSLATAVKSAVKHRVDRTRPNLLMDEGRYGWAAGASREHDETSFPSGHTAGALAVAGTFARDYPTHRAAAWIAAGLVSAMQVPRCKHYPSDVGAGAAIGLATAALVNAVDRAADRAAVGRGAGGVAAAG